MRQKAIECLDCGYITSPLGNLDLCTICGSNNVERITFDPDSPNDEDDDD